MIDTGVKEQLAHAESREDVQSLLLQWTDSPDPSLFEGVNDKRKRLQLLGDYYQGRKASALRFLASADGIRVNDLPNSGSVILTGSVAKLQKILETGSLLDREPGIQVLPNITFHALT